MYAATGMWRNSASPTGRLTLMCKAADRRGAACVLVRESVRLAGSASCSSTEAVPGRLMEAVMKQQRTAAPRDDGGADIACR
eukprot:5146421-Prymnesium_polylepis.1